MRCPNPECGSLNDRVANNRPKDNNTVARRRRECLDCGHRWTTYEFSAEALRDDDNTDLIKFLGEDDD